MKRLVVAAVMLIPQMATAAEMTFNIGKTKSGDEFLIADGSISDLTPYLLGAMVASGRWKDKVILLNSKGGSVVSALEMGRIIRGQGMATMVKPGDFCLSACAYMFLGGDERFVPKGAVLGMHRFRFGNDEADKKTLTNEAQSLSGSLIEYFVEMGVSAEALAAAMRAGPDDMYVFTQDEMQKYRITFERTRSASAAPCIPAYFQDPLGLYKDQPRCN